MKNSFCFITDLLVLLTLINIPQPVSCTLSNSVLKAKNYFFRCFFFRTKTRWVKYVKSSFHNWSCCCVGAGILSFTQSQMRFCACSCFAINTSDLTGFLVCAQWISQSLIDKKLNCSVLKTFLLHCIYIFPMLIVSGWLFIVCNKSFWHSFHTEIGRNWTRYVSDQYRKWWMALAEK